MYSSYADSELQCQLKNKSVLKALQKAREHAMLLMGEEYGSRSLNCRQ